MPNLKLKMANGKRDYHRYVILPQTKKNPLRNFKIHFVQYSDRDLI